MFDHLQIADRRERWIVGLADAGLALAGAVVRPFGGRAVRPSAPRRVLLLRLERIGDLLMSIPALAAVRRLAPDARLDLVVGSWNEPVARMIGLVDRIETLDAWWLSRGAPAPGFAQLVRLAGRWRAEQYDVAINFEGDIRSHLLMARSGAPRRVGFDMAGGGPLLTDRVPYDPTRHVADNLVRLVQRAFEAQPATAADLCARSEASPPLAIPAEARKRADDLLRAGGGELLVGIHVGAGRRVKQWDPARFGEVAARLAETHRARFVFTGSEEDRPLVEAAMARLPPGVDAIDACGRADLALLAALIEQTSVFITCDSGPMHLAAAIGTPLVAIFGPSDPRRWGPLSANARVVHADVECRPCNRIRTPPGRCTGVMPDCLAAIDAARVVETVEELLRSAGPRRVTVETSDAGR